MKKNVFLLGLLLGSSLVYCQVGINTSQPMGTLDVAALTTNGSTAEGFIAPRLTGDQIKSADTKYGNNQKGTIIYATSSVTSPVPGSKTENITAEGYYYFDGSNWQTFRNGVSYAGSSSVTLAANSFQRAALTGDVTAAANSNITTISDNAVTSAKIADDAVAAVDIANNAVTVAKLPAGATGTSYLRGDGVWAQLPISKMYYKYYQFTNMDGDYVANFDTKIPTSSYTAIVVGFDTNHASSATAGFTNSYTGYNFQTPDILTFQQGGTWRIKADVPNATTTASPFYWGIRVLVISNEQVTLLPSEGFNLGGGVSGAATASPVP
ncbi:hypothetical protein DBR28_20520 [Chryseobacterium sp. HMWF028]|nr:hypothetical protein DBR28_20520 [Chryseobacterium sp. HMWF028]